MSQALGIALEYCACVAPFGFRLEVLVYLFGLVAGDEDSFGGLEGEGVFYDPVDNGFAAYGQQALGQVVGVGAHALALAGDWQNDFHFLLIPLVLCCKMEVVAQR